MRAAQKLNITISNNNDTNGLHKQETIRIIALYPSRIFRISCDFKLRMVCKKWYILVNIDRHLSEDKIGCTIFYTTMAFKKFKG